MTVLDVPDRRGFSRNRLDGPQDYGRRLETDADHVRRLVEHLGDEPATVFGVSSGAIVALALLTYHRRWCARSSRSNRPSCGICRGGQKWLGFTETYDLLPGGHVGFVAHPAEFARELDRGVSL